jgi:hypothetical protein
MVRVECGSQCLIILLQSIHLSREFGNFLGESMNTLFLLHHRLFQCLDANTTVVLLLCGSLDAKIWMWMRKYGQKTNAKLW